MYAVVEIAGKQYTVEKDALVNVDRLEGAQADMTFDKVIVFADGDKVLVGQPYVTNVKVKAQVVTEVKGKKVRGIKFKRRKNYQRTLGHRAQYTQLKINDLVVS